MRKSLSVSRIICTAIAVLACIAAVLIIDSVSVSAESVVYLQVGDTYTIETGMTLGSDEMLDANWYVTNPSGITAVKISGKTYDTADCTIKAVASSGGQVVTVRVEYQQYLGYPYTDLLTAVSYYKFIVYDEGEETQDILGSGTTLNVNWTLTADGLLRIYGEGKMGDYNAQYVPWYSLRESITSVVVESGVTHIGNNNFSGCTNLTSISIPDTVTSIGGAFGDCTAMTDYVVDENNTAYCSLDGVLFDKDMTTLLKYPAARTQTYNVPSSVTTLGSSCFSNCSWITDVVIGGGVTDIKAQAFMSCTNLKSAVIGDGVESIGTSAFYGCSALEDVSISDDVTSIGVQGFAYCYALRDITIPANLTSISNWTFGCCKALESVAIPAGVTSIGGAAFFGYYDIDRQIYYGGSEDEWNSINIESNNNGLDTAVIHYNEYDENKVSQDTVAQTIIVGTASADDTEPTAMPTASPTATATATPTISDNYTINSLEYDKLDDGQVCIDVSLTKDSGDTGTDLVIIAVFDEYGVMTGCDLCEISLETGQSKIVSATLSSGKTIKAFVWSSASNMIPLSETSVMEISGNDDSDNGDYIAQGTCGDNVTWTLDSDGLLTISGSGAMTDYFGDHIYEPSPWNEYTDKFITSAIIKDGVTSLGGGALYACGNLSKIEIPSSVERIGMLAVSWTSITELVIPEGVKTIEEEAFEGNSALTAVSIPSSVTYIGESAFMDCDLLSNVYYAGSQSDWEAISIGDYNEPLENAVINYNSSL